MSFFEYLTSIDKKVAIAAALFFLSGFYSLFVGGFDQKKLGQFIVLFLQPMSLFVIGGYIFRQNPKAKTWMVNAIYFLLAAAGIFAVIQYFTLHGLPTQYWGNSIEPKRAVSFFGHPDFYALFAAPLLAFLIPDLLFQFSIFNFSAIGGSAYGGQFSKLWKLVLWLLGSVGLFLSLSRAGWLGLAAAIIIYAIISKNKFARRLIIIGAMAAIIIIAIIPNWRYRAIGPFLGEKSASSRTQLWGYGWTTIKQSPLLGTGLNGFSLKWSTLNTDPAQNSANFPHNIFLDLWVDLGLIGLISFTWLCLIYIYRGLKSISTTNSLALSITLFLLTLLIQGQFDNPYFRNDLALVFWIILSLHL